MNIPPYQTSTPDFREQTNLFFENTKRAAIDMGSNYLIREKLKKHKQSYPAEH